MKAYFYYGKMLFVDSLRNGSYCTMVDDASGCPHPLHITALPIRKTYREAQTDLEAFAEQHRLKEAE